MVTDWAAATEARQLEALCGEEATSPFEAVKLSAAMYGDNDAIHIPLTACSEYAEQAITYTYQALIDAVLDAVTLWAATGVNGRVALVLENRPEFFIHWLALNALGLSVIPLSHELGDEEIPYYLGHGSAVALVTLEKHLARMSRISNRLAEPIPTVTTDQLETLTLGRERATAEHSSASECALLYTSGSTGKPKGCVLSNDYFVQQGVWYRTLGGHVGLRVAQERLLTPLPLSHMNAMSVSAMAMFMTAGCLIQLDRFHPRTWWQSVRVSEATAIHYLGVLPAILLALPKAENEDFSGQVRFGFGAGVSSAHHHHFEERFGFPLIEAWAMTECGAGGAIICAEEPRHVGKCCFGKPSELVDWELVDDRGMTVPRGQVGELRVRAAGDDPRKGFFSGYLKDTAATEMVWQDGWLNTGDLVKELPDGNLVFVDRKKNIIRRSGENISAIEIEAVASDFPAVEVVVSVPVFDEFRGDEVALCVVVREGAVANFDLARTIQKHCLEKLSYFKAPGWIIFCAALPVTASNKPRRGEIKELANSAVSAGTALDLRAFKVRKK